MRPKNPCMQTGISAGPESRVARGGYSQSVLNQIKDTLHVLRPYFDDEEVNEIMVNVAWHHDKIEQYFTSIESVR